MGPKEGEKRAPIKKVGSRNRGRGMEKGKKRKKKKRKEII